MTPPSSVDAPRALDQRIALALAALGGVLAFVLLERHLLWRAPSYPTAAMLFGVGAAAGCAAGLYWLARRVGLRVWEAARTLVGSALRGLVGSLASSGGSPIRRPVSRRAVLGIVAAGVACHGLLLLNDGTYFDGWLVRYVWVTGEHEILRDFFSRVGIPLLYLTHLPQLQVPGFPFCYQLTTFLFLIGNSVLAYLVLLRVGVFSQTTAFTVALLEVVSPLFFSTFEVTTNQYTLFRLVFMLSLFLILGPRPSSRSLRVARGALLTGLLWVSFNLNSLLVVFYPLIGLVWLARHGSGVWRVRFWLDPWRLWLLAQPVLHWLGKRFVHPPHGDNVTNNQVTSLGKGVSVQLWTSPLSVVRDTLVPLEWLARERPLIMVALLGVFAALGYRRWRARSPEPVIRPESEAAPLWLVASGGVLVLAGVYPYLTVGRVFPFHRGGSAHYNLLLALPAAMIVTGLAQTLCGRRRRAWSFAGLGLLAAASAIWCSSSYLRWEVRGIRAEALVQQIRALPTRDYAVFGATSTMRFGDGRDAVNGYTLTFLLATVEGEFRAIVIPDGELDPAQSEDVETFVDTWRLRPYLSGVDRSGPRGQLLLSHGPGFRDDTAGVFEYYRLKFFEPEALPRYLAGYVTVKLVPRPQVGEEQSDPKRH